MGVEIYELDAAKFLSAPGLALPGALKKTKVKLELLNYINMLIMVEKGIRCGLCQWRIVISKTSGRKKPKQALNHGLVLAKNNKTTKFKQKAWLKSNININT